MQPLITDTNLALQKFDPSQRYWHDTVVVVESTGPTIVTYWRNPELAGIWEFRYALCPVCFSNMLHSGYIERSNAQDPHQYRLTPLGQSQI
jgi:hypothetical protein